jgi:hypothetical protein
MAHCINWDTMLSIPPKRQHKTHHPHIKDIFNLPAHIKEILNKFVPISVDQEFISLDDGLNSISQKAETSNHVNLTCWPPSNAPLKGG